MPRNLTRASETSSRWFIEFNREALAELDQSSAPGKLWRVHYELAVNLYADDADVAEVREHFVQAAGFGVAAYERVPLPTASKIRVPNDFRQLLGVVAAFGADDLHSRVANVERWKWLHPEVPLHALLADGLQHLQRFLSGTLDAAAATATIEQTRSDVADRQAVRFVAPLLSGLLAVAAGDQATFDRCLVALLDEHRYQALHGDNQRSHDGLVAVVPLGLARLAREANLMVAADSPYLPLAALG